MADISEEIKVIIARQLEIKEEKVTENSRMVDDLGADSLDVLELLSIFEEKFDIYIPDEGDNKIITVRDLVSYIEMKIEQK